MPTSVLDMLGSRESLDLIDSLTFEANCYHKALGQVYYFCAENVTFSLFI